MTEPGEGRVCPVCDIFHADAHFHEPNAHVCDACKREGCEIPPEPQSFIDARRQLKQMQVMEVEMASRMLSRRRFLHYVKRFKPNYSDGWVHRDIARRLERFMQDVADKKSPRLLLCMPPRHGKSELTSRNFPSWVLGHHPEWEIIAASHTQSLALSFSRHIRDRVRDPAYQAIFPDCKLDENSQSVENWLTTEQGGYLAAGVGTGITGRGAHIGIIDDPVKDMEAADSELIRENTWEWYLSTFYTRLAPGAGVLGILTLWNEDDWGGRIITQNEMEDGDKFEIVRYPAINEGYDEYVDQDDHIVKVYPGQPTPDNATLTRLANTALHEERYDLGYLQKLKKAYYATGKQRIWHALYQQAPAPEDGLFFTKEMVKYGDFEKRSTYNVYQAWDFAITEKQQNDWTSCTTIWQTPEGNYIIAEVRRFKSNDGEAIVDRILDAYEEHKPNFVGFEDGQIFKSLRSTFTRRCQERLLYPAYDLLVPLTDKFVRAGPLKGLMQSGRVTVQSGRDWTKDFVDELLKFGAAKHDDMCFVVDTQITMADGSQRPIQNVREGDSVWTPDGPAVVSAAGLTSYAAEVYDLDDKLIGTAAHPVWTENRGWVPLHSLTDSDILQLVVSQDCEESSCRGFTKKLRSAWKRWSSTGRSTAVTLSPRGPISDATSVGRAGEGSSTGTSGSFTTDLFRQGITSITLMKIISTTPSLISHVSQLQSIAPTNTAPSLFTRTPKPSASTWSASGILRRLGTLLKKVGLGTKPTGSTPTRTGSSSRTRAPSAESLSSRTRASQSSVVGAAATRLGSRTTPVMKPPRKLEEKRAVYNLTVSERHCYYANGVLVHNCDSTAWCIRVAIEHQPQRAKAPTPKVKSWKEKLKYHAAHGVGHMAA